MVFCVSKNHGQTKKHCHLLCFDGHCHLEGSQVTVNPHTTRQSHKLLAPHPTHHTPPATPNHTEPNRTEPSHNEPSRRAKQSQAKPSKAKQSQARVSHATTTTRQVTPRQNRPRPFGRGQFQFKESVVDASASPVAALLIQWEEGCDEG